MSHIFLIGFMGAGKSTVAELVAQRLGRPYVDLDRLVESTDGRPVAQIFADDGESAFRQKESVALSSLADAPPSVVACGGGVVMSEENRAALRAMGTVVYLSVTADEMIARVGADPRRPLAVGIDVLTARALLDSRESLYSAVAGTVVDTVGLSPSVVADEVVEFLRGRDAQ